MNTGTLVSTEKLDATKTNASGQQHVEAWNRHSNISPWTEHSVRREAAANAHAVHASNRYVLRTAASATTVFDARDYPVVTASLTPG